MTGLLLLEQSAQQYMDITEVNVYEKKGIVMYLFF